MAWEHLLETLDAQAVHTGENAPHAYFIPFDADQDPCAPRTESRRMTLLNGEWEFRYYPSFRDFGKDFDPALETLDRTMPVPGVWQMNGCDSMQYTSTDGGKTLNAIRTFTLAGIVSSTEIKYFISHNLFILIRLFVIITKFINPTTYPL